MNVKPRQLYMMNKADDDCEAKVDDEASIADTEPRSGGID